MSRPSGTRLAVITAVAAVAGCAHAAHVPSPPEGLSSRPFAASSFWNQPRAASASVDPRSGPLVGDLSRQVGLYGVNLDVGSYSTPVYVTHDGATVRVALDQACCRQLAAAFARVPLPADAQPAPGTDGHLVVVDAKTDTMYEFFRLDHHAADGWHASWGGVMRGFSHANGRFRAPYGATASGLPLLGGLLLPTDTTQVIRHALAMSIPIVAAGHRYPASRDDGKGDVGLQEGTWLRLDPSVDVARLPGGDAIRALARAAQDYGIFVRDRAAAVTFYGEQPTGGTIDPFYSWLGGPPGVALRWFPFDRLQVITPPNS